MNMKRKTSGFFIVEILIVLVIVGILVIALLPNLTTYTNRAKFIDVINVANSYKAAVGHCIAKNNGVLTSCDNGSESIRAAMTAATANVALGSGTVMDGTITATGTASPGPGAFNYVLTPTVNADGHTTWIASGTCLAQSLC